MATKSIIRNSILSIGVAASLAVGTLGIGSAEARINGDPASPKAQMCKTIQDNYDKAVQDYHNATTPEELLSARAELNIWADDWKSRGCAADYGDIRFIQAGNQTVLDSGLTAQPVTSSQTLSPAAVPSRGLR